MLKKDKLKNLNDEISGTIAAGEIEKAADEILLKYGENAKVAGFRPGHIPVAVLRQRYGNAAEQDAVNKLMNADLDAFVADKKIKLAGAPRADLGKYVSGKDAEYTLDFDILPELPKIDLEKITLTKKAAAVDDKAVDAALENIRKGRSDFQKQDAGYKLASGDIAVIDFTGFVAGEKFAGGEAKNHHLTLGSGQFIPGFEDQIIGHALGDQFDVNVKFPKEYHSAELAGKDAKFAVKINEARHPILPELNEDFAKAVGLESIAKLRENVREVLQKQNDDNMQNELRNELLDALADKVKLDLPETIVEQEIAAGEKSGDEKKDRKEAERRVKLGLILAEWGQANEVKVAREELQQAIWSEASRFPNPQEVFEYYNKNPQALSMLNGMLFERKTLDAMIKLCKVK
ncbi:MAG: trigger factor [Rickettsiales bacterium]|jgi:trigger factor|nr:trigger factor [Rickettsiales bacterium]